MLIQFKMKNKLTADDSEQSETEFREIFTTND